MVRNRSEKRECSPQNASGVVNKRGEYRVPDRHINQVDSVLPQL